MNKNDNNVSFELKTISDEDLVSLEEICENNNTTPDILVQSFIKKTINEAKNDGFKENTVGYFYDLISLNEKHQIRIKSFKSDEVLNYISSWKDVTDDIKDKIIMNMATDWENKIYILWI